MVKIIPCIFISESFYFDTKLVLHNGNEDWNDSAYIIFMFEEENLGDSSSIIYERNKPLSSCDIGNLEWPIFDCESNKKEEDFYYGLLQRKPLYFNKFTYITMKVLTINMLEQRRKYTFKTINEVCAKQKWLCQRI